MEVRLGQLEKALSPMLVTLLGITDVEHPTIKVLLLVSIIALQPLRESYTVFPSATMISMRLLQPEKRALPISITLLGIVIVVRLLQYPKATSPMLVTLSGILMVVRPLQSLKAVAPMLVTLSGMVIEVRLLQPKKAALPIVVTPLGILMAVRLLQY